MGLAYALRGEERFPRKIAHYILSWVEALTPRFPFESSVGDLGVAISAMYYGVDLVWRSRGFTDEDKYRLAMWADELACDLESKPIAFRNRREVGYPPFMLLPLSPSKTPNGSTSHSMDSVL